MTKKATTAATTDAKPAMTLTRREAIARVSALFGGASLVGGNALLTGCATTPSREHASGLFTAADVELLDELAETMLPETSTPGAKAAGVGPFIALMVEDTYDPNERRTFTDGLDALQSQCRATYGAAFLDLDAGRRLQFVERLDREQYDYMNARGAGDPVHHFRMFKELALLGYFTSEVGYTQAMRYAETPGRFEPCTVLQPGDTIWADHA